MSLRFRERTWRMPVQDSRSDPLGDPASVGIAAYGQLVAPSGRIGDNAFIGAPFRIEWKEATIVPSLQNAKPIP